MSQVPSAVNIVDPVTQSASFAFQQIAENANQAADRTQRAGLAQFEAQQAQQQQAAQMEFAAKQAELDRQQSDVHFREAQKFEKSQMEADRAIQENVRKRQDELASRLAQARAQALQSPESPELKRVLDEVDAADQEEAGFAADLAAASMALGVSQGETEAFLQNATTTYDEYLKTMTDARSAIAAQTASSMESYTPIAADREVRGEADRMASFGTTPTPGGSVQVDWEQLARTAAPGLAPEQSQAFARMLSAAATASDPSVDPMVRQQMVDGIMQSAQEFNASEMLGILGGMKAALAARKQQAPGENDPNKGERIRQWTSTVERAIGRIEGSKVFRDVSTSPQFRTRLFSAIRKAIQSGDSSMLEAVRTEADAAGIDTLAIEQAAQAERTAAGRERAAREGLAGAERRGRAGSSKALRGVEAERRRREQAQAVAEARALDEFAKGNR